MGSSSPLKRKLTRTCHTAVPLRRVIWSTSAPLLPSWATSAPRLPQHMTICSARYAMLGLERWKIQSQFTVHSMHVEPHWEAMLQLAACLMWRPRPWSNCTGCKCLTS
jgi:hypothetical protein